MKSQKKFFSNLDTLTCCVTSILTLLFFVFYIRTVRIPPASWLPEIVKEFFSIDFIDVSKHEYWGQIGDYFGGILNPFFSLVTIGIVLYTYFTSTKYQQKTAFDDRLLSLINLNREILKNIRIDNQTSGIDAMEQFVTKIYEGCDHCLFLTIDKSNPTTEQVSKAYEHYYGHHGYVKYLGHYFRNLYHIVKYVDDSKKEKIISDREAQKNIDLLLSHLNDDELILLFFNGLSTYGVKFKQYIEAYAMFENLSFAAIAGASERNSKLGCGVFKLYEVSAYGTWSGKQPGFTKPANCEECPPQFSLR